MQIPSKQGDLQQPKRLRKPGGGRKKAENKDPTLINHLEDIMKESTAGDPISLLKWTFKSTYAIAEELQLKGHDVSHDTVRRLLKEDGYSLQANKKTREMMAKVVAKAVARAVARII